MMYCHSKSGRAVGAMVFLVTLCFAGPRGGCARDKAGAPPEGDLPSVQFHDAPQIQITGVDSNSPAHWDGDTLYVFNSYGHPWRNSGPDISHLGNRISTKLGDLNDKLYIWIEATWKDEDDGVLYGAYHYELDDVCVSNNHLPTMPKIGWIRSLDNGATWEDLGFIIEAKPCAVRCDSASPWDVGGTGDFVIYLDNKKEYFYFYGTSYDSRFEEQGVWAARMRYADRKNPSGKVVKWYQGAWSEPALWGHLTPVFPAERDYHTRDGSMFWGPAIHWNTYLNTYVMFLNHAVDTKLTQDGIFISFNPDVGNPAGWTKPRMILNRAEIQKAMAGADVSPTKLENGWYPEVIGMQKGETDKVVGRTARFFVAGLSRKTVTFLRPGEKVP
jgi:hypothetical protein